MLSSVEGLSAFSETVIKQGITVTSTKRYFIWIKPEWLVLEHKTQNCETMV